MWNNVKSNPQLSKMFYEPTEVMECLKQQVFFDYNMKFGYDHIGDGNVFMQYTGIKDNNGIEIYEGDILYIGRSDFGYFKKNEFDNAEYEVKLEGCEYILYRNDIHLSWGRLSRIQELNYECRVIGNVFEPIDDLN